MRIRSILHQPPIINLFKISLNMIELCVQNNKACVYSLEDWEYLRKHYRIIGTFLGTTQYTPAFPVCLLPEEVALLANKQFAKLVHYPNLTNAPLEEQSDLYTRLHKDLLCEEQKIYREKRRADLAPIIDKIVEGKKKRCVGIESRTSEEILEEELAKSCDITETTCIWPIFVESLAAIKGQAVDVPLSDILTQTTPTKCAVYRDLWEKGYYITPGITFGCDFLVYLGDPIIFHAIYMVQCVENPDAQTHMTELIAFGRLATSVKKKAIFSSLMTDGTVSYITLNWLDA